MNTNSHESRSNRLLQSVGSHLSHIIGCSRVCNPPLIIDDPPRDFRGSRARSPHQRYRGSRSRFARNLGIIRKPREFRNSSRRCWTQDAKRHARPGSAKLPAIGNSPIDVNLAQRKANCAIQRSLPRRLLILDPLQKVWDRICANPVNCVFPGRAASDVLSAWSLHPLTQLLPLVLRLPLRPGQQNDPANHDSEANQCHINASLSHRSTIMRSRLPHASRKYFTEGNEVNKDGEIFLRSLRSLLFKSHSRRFAFIRGSLPSKPFRTLHSVCSCHTFPISAFCFLLSAFRTPKSITNYENPFTKRSLTEHP